MLHEYENSAHWLPGIYAASVLSKQPRLRKVRSIGALGPRDEWAFALGEGAPRQASTAIGTVFC